MRTPQKILIVLPSLCGGGAERLHISLANNWAVQGFRVSFALMRMEGELIELVDKHVCLVDLAAPRIREVPIALARLLKKLNPDIVLVAMWPLTTVSVIGWILSGRKGRIFLSDHTNLSVSNPYENQTSLALLACSMYFSYRLANGIIAVSKGVKDEICNLTKISHSKIRVIYNPAAKGVRENKSQRGDYMQLWEGHSGYKILSVGTLKIQKDHETLLRAFALLPNSINVKLVILGEGPLREHLARLAKELGVSNRISMPGFVLDPVPWFSSADLFVLSSRWEGFGNVIVESLECGTPVVSTDCPSGPAEILDNGRYGELVPVQDAPLLARAIERSLKKSPNRSLLKKRAREFSVKTISKLYIDYFYHA